MRNARSSMANNVTYAKDVIYSVHAELIKLIRDSVVHFA
jgi:hypothetical protein